MVGADWKDMPSFSPKFLHFAIYCSCTLCYLALDFGYDCSKVVK
jgi:hypothetical protein